MAGKYDLLVAVGITLKNFLWAISTALLGIAIGFLIYSFGNHGGFDRGSHALSSAAGAALPAMPAFPTLPALPSVSLSQPMTILFMGTDVVYEREHGKLEVEPAATNGNSDTMMLVFINPARNQVNVLNIPRDTEALVGKYGVRKINSANVLGGPDLAKATVTGLLNVPIDHYIVLNVQGLVQLVNELGGVTIEVPKKMSYMDWTAKLKIDLQPGTHTLTGNQAMGFVRFRHDALGDIGRVQRQQMFLQAVIRKMADPRAWVHVPALIDIAGKSVRTDLTNLELIEALNFVHGLPKNNFKFVMLPGQFAQNGDWLATTDGLDLAARLANPDAETVSSRSDVGVCIVNATSDPHAGRKIARALSKLGYNTCVAQDEPDAARVTQIIAQNGNTADAQTLQRDLGNVGEIINASLGNLTSSITIRVHDDLIVDKIQLSSVDVPSVKHRTAAQPIAVHPIETPPSSVPLAAADLSQQTDSTASSDMRSSNDTPAADAASSAASETPASLEGASQAGETQSLSAGESSPESAVSAGSAPR